MSLSIAVCLSTVYTSTQCFGTTDIIFIRNDDMIQAMIRDNCISMETSACHCLLNNAICIIKI